MTVTAENGAAGATYSGEVDITILELNNKLDDLWSRYLTQLEVYQAAQLTLQEQLSAAFFSLAQANFSKVSGRRYGRDYYDQRAIASVRVCVKQPTTKKTEHSESSPSDHWAIIKKQASAKDADSLSEDVANLKLQKGHESKPVGGEDASQLNNKERHTPEATKTPPLNNSTAEKNNTDAPPVNSLRDDDIAEQDPTDPLRSFAGGILIPLQLRKTRDTFASLFQISDTPGSGSTNCSIVQAVVAARRMRDIEADIRRIRKVIRKAEKESEAK